MSAVGTRWGRAGLGWEGRGLTSILAELVRSAQLDRILDKIWLGCGIVISAILSG